MAKTSKTTKTAPKSKAASSTTDELVFLPLGGSGEIGMNLNLYGYGPAHDRKWIMVDCGVTFGDASTPGVDIIMPDPEFIVQNRDNLLGLVLTHAHEDHLGALPWLWDELRCPVYATPFCAFLAREKLREANLLGEVPLHEIPLGGKLTLGPFDIEFVTLTHSIPEPNGLAITTPAGVVLHTGDWKIDDAPTVGPVTDVAAIRALGTSGVLAMVCDSTNVFENGRSGSEEGVAEALKALVGELKGKVAITGFASNIGRVHSILKAAEAADRRVCLVGRSLGRYVAAARSVGFLEDVPPFITDAEAGFFPDENILYLCTGSQGEARAALARIADGSHPHVKLGEGDTVIFSSRVIPGNELGIRGLQNKLAARGVRIVTDRERPIHVSGHPCKDELADMYAWARPRIAVPTHGEHRHLVEHARFAKELQIPHTIVPENGQMIRLSEAGAEVIDIVPSGRLFADGGFVTPADDDALRHRRKMAYAGHISISFVVDGKGKIKAGPEVRLAGLPEDAEDTHDELKDDLAAEAKDAFRRIDPRSLENLSACETLVGRAVRKLAERIWDKRPIVEVVILQIA
jgi:ribonuclease J